MKKKILFVTNHFRFSNGVATVLRNLIANLDENEYDISLLALYEFNEEFAKPIINKINVVKGFDFYFRGFDKIINLFSPKIYMKCLLRNIMIWKLHFNLGCLQSA